MADQLNKENLLEFRSLLEEIENTLEDLAQDQGKAFTNTLLSAKDALSEISMEAEIAKNATTSQLNAIQAIGTTFENILKNAKDIGSEEFESLKPDDILLGNDLLIDRDRLYELLSQAIVDASKKHESMNSIITKSTSQLNDLIDDFISKVKSLPGSDYFIKLFNFDEIGDSIKSNMSDRLKQFVKDGDLSAVAVSKAFRGAFAEIGASISSTIGVMGIAIIGIISLLAVAGERFIEIDKTTQSTRESTGFIGDNLNKIVIATQKLNVENARYGIDLDKSSEITSAILDKFSSLNYVTEQNLKTLAALNVVIGLGASESAALLEIFTNITGTTGENLDNLSLQIQSLSDINKIAPQQIFEEIAQSGAVIYENMELTSDVILNTAVRARQLGIELNTVTGIAQNLLNFESSIESQMSASVLLGKQLNFEYARYLAFLGKTDEMLVEIVSQVGSFEELQSLFPHQQRALAEAIGVSVAELRNMVRSQEVLNELGEGFVDTYSQLKTGKSISELLDAEGVLTPLESLKNSLSSMIVSFGTILLPLLNLLAPALKVLAGGLNILADGMALVTDGIGGVIELIPGIGDVATVVTNVLGGLAVAATAFFIGSNPIGWAVGIIGAFGLIKRNWEDIVNFFESSGSFLYDFVTSSFEKIRSFIISAMDSLGSFLYDFVTSPFERIYDFIVSIGSSLIDAIVWPFEEAWNIVFGNTIWDTEAISDVFSNIMESMESFLSLSSFADKISSVVDAIIPDSFDIQTPKTIEQVVTIKDETASKPTESVNREMKVDMSGLEEKLDILIDLMKQGKVINIDGKKVGKAIAATQITF